MENQELQEEYFLVSLLGNSNRMLSLQEEKRLSESEYHPVDTEEVGEYYILEKIEKEAKYCLLPSDVSGEVYQTYEFQPVSFQRVNNFTLDGFLYDQEREVVFYAYIYGLYAVKRGDAYYSVITDEEIPKEVIDGISKRETVDDFMDMIEDLEIIGKHKELYLKIMKEAICLLMEGVNNKRVARNRSKANYEKVRIAYEKTDGAKRTKEEREKAWKEHLRSLKRQEMAIDSKRVQVKQIIRQIQNNN